jgi:hypothetical protein
MQLLTLKKKKIMAKEKKMFCFYHTFGFCVFHCYLINNSAAKRCCTTSPAATARLFFKTKQLTLFINI